MGEVSIGSAVEKLEADTVKARNEGLDDLKHILGQSRGTSRLDSVGDEGFHKIFEALFRIVRIEKPAYLRATKPTTKNNAASRLSVAATALRLAVEAGCTKIKHKTANAILDHIVGNLPTNDQGFCLPLRNDYLKSFRVLLEFAPHGEHFRSKQWQTLVDFVLNGIGHDSGEPELRGTATPTLDRSIDSRNGDHLSVRVSQASGSRSSRTEAASSVDELMSCLKLLTAITNAPLMSRAVDIVQTLIEFLAFAGRSQEAAFDALNNILLTALTENTTLARQAVQDVIPAIRRLWPTRSAALRDQMLTTLAISEGFFLEAVQDASGLGAAQMRSLLSILIQEYARRSEREVLQLDDVTMLHDTASPLLGTRVVGPVLDSPRGVSNWVTLSVMASIIIGLDKRESQIRGESPFDDTVRKRPKLTSPIDELLHQATAAPGQERLCAIQLLLFVLDRSSRVAERVIGHILQLADGVLDDDPAVASWIQIMFSQLAHDDKASSDEFSEGWRQVWSSATRNLSGSATCRAACHLLESMLRTKVLKEVADPTVLENALFSNGMSGPCALSDAAIQLWTTMMATGLFDTAKSFQSISNKCIQWLNTYWTFPTVLDRLHNFQMAFHLQTENLYQLLMSNANQAVNLQVVRNEVNTNPIYRALLLLSDRLPFHRYLLDNDAPGRAMPTNPRIVNTQLSIDNADVLRPQQLVLDMLYSKVKAFREAWNVLGNERSSNISNDVLRMSATLCAVSNAICTMLNQSLSQKCEAISKLIEEFWSVICIFVAKQEGDSRRKSLTVIAATLLRLQVPKTAENIALAQGRAALTAPILNLLKEELDNQSSSAEIDVDLMDLEESFPPQASQAHLETAAAEGPRQYLPVIGDLRSAMVHFTTSLLIENILSNQSDHVDSEASSKIVDFVQTLNPSTLLAARIALLSLFQSSPAISRADACRLLKKLGESCLQHDDYERCEASLCFCLDIMTSLAGLWTLEDDGLAAVASDIYGWYLDVAEGKGIASTKVMFGIASMLEAVMAVDPSFGADAAFPSPRTGLFQILKVGDNNLRFHLAGKMSHIFDRFVLTEHDAIFNDVLESLPSDPEDTEGIAVRLYVLGELASQWHTVLRPAVYGLFEIPAHIPSSTRAAQQCLRRVCRALNLEFPRNLLFLFAPQILYTWLEKETIDSIPFRTFEYVKLQDLLHDLQDEVVGQIAMRGSDTLSKSLSRIIGIPWRDLLSSSFVKAEAYAVARDINIPRETEGAKSSESSIRKQLGAETYLALVRDRFPEIVASLFVTLGDLEGVDRAFARRPDMGAAKDAFALICSRGYSTVALPAAQQPSFRAKYLIDELQFLCQRIEQDPSIIWTPALLTYLYRTLLDDAVPALGPLHACSILRKIRILVSLAGPNALEGYSLEMLLHNLRPYLTSFHCSEDTLGLFWYLLEHGKQYLASRMSFLLGLSVATFAAISRFMKSSQDSTTQESHFRSTMSKVHDFHEWFGKYLVDLKALAADQDLAKRFSKISKISASITKSGSSIKGSVESDLLLALLEDQVSKQPLLTDSAFRLAIEILCSEFELAADPAADILGDRDETFLFAPVLATLPQQLRLPQSFHTWVAQALGHTYAAKGSRDRVSDASLCLDENASISTSYSIIFRRLEAIMRQNDPHAAGLAERTLQMISTALNAHQRLTICGSDVESNLLEDLAFSGFPCPQLENEGSMSPEKSLLEHWADGLSLAAWASALAQELCAQCSTDAVLAALPVSLAKLPLFAVHVVPSIIHIVLSSENSQQHSVRHSLSTAFGEALRDHRPVVSGHLRVIVNTLLHLRRMPLPREVTMADRNSWLDVDLGEAAAAALQCEMFSAALLFLELKATQQSLQSSRSSRRSSVSNLDGLAEIMPIIFQSVHDPDFFYSVQETPTMASLIKKLTHEGSDHKTLSFQSALYDSVLKSSLGENTANNESAMFSALSNANFDGLAKALQIRSGPGIGSDTSNSALQVSLNLHQWEMPPQVAQSAIARVMLDVFQTTNTASDKAIVTQSLDKALSTILDAVPVPRLESGQCHESLSAMALLTEMREALGASSFQDLEDVCQRFELKDWDTIESFEKISPILLGREALFSTIQSNGRLQAIVNISPLEAQLLEVRTVRNSLKIARDYHAAQFCLNRAVYLTQLSEAAAKRGLKVDALAQHQLAMTMWDQGEAAASIQILRSLRARDDLSHQNIVVSSAEILADLGHEVAEARLDKPDEIIRSYLLPAIKELNGLTDGAEAGRVFHDFAAFCDMQLQNADDLDDYNRIERIRNRKEKEVLDLEKMVSKATDAKQKEHLKRLYLDKAKTWFKLDDEEYRRLKANRDKFAQQCLENYLLSLKACDKYGNDVLRFVALWMNQADSHPANTAVGKYLPAVPSRKFAPLMNQLSSRILDQESDFQKLLYDLLYRICCDHPYHSLYQVFATSKSKGAKTDEIAASRHAAAGKLADHVMKSDASGRQWVAIHNSSISFVRLANERLPDKKLKSGSKMALRDLPSGLKLEQTTRDAHTKTPPPTMKIELRADRDYTSIPTYSKFDPLFSIAGGVSAPKIVTIIASDGSRHKMLLKGGNDDLRQDSIMEQVFEQVSNLLKDHRATRQRSLGIRTYKVIPLTPNAGIIEFVKDTIPLHEYLLPAHQRYFPKDYKPNRCRKEIADAQTKSLSQRLQAYRTVCANFHPVMRFFFMEHFLDPDEWFQKRLNYSRSTAAISILGHVLGLGDRHGHNILLDEQTGEVVHIDLGVAFEAGRVLPVPEVVPFRLTRDLVDGMGLSGVEGVFRRCCKFTLEALRIDQYSIMTILDVLRYDPLYSWSVSPLRLQRMQEEQENAAAATAAAAANASMTTSVAETSFAGPAGTRNANEPSEADRVLTVVAKKLGKSLSAEATVNELIQQATDEKNLASLYCGWAAYA